MVNNTFWHKKWQANEIGFDQSEVNPFLKNYFSQLSLHANASIFVPLCGKSIDIKWMVEQGYQVIGVELSPIACDSFFKTYQLPVTIHQIENFILYQSDKVTIFCGDFFNLTQQMIGKIDAIYDRAALIALPQTVRQRYCQHLCQLMSPQTIIFLITIVYDQHEMNGPPFSVEKKEILKLFGKQFRIDLKASESFVFKKYLKAQNQLVLCQFK